jgi:hypothetical protein
MVARLTMHITTFFFLFLEQNAKKQCRAPFRSQIFITFGTFCYYSVFVCI